MPALQLNLEVWFLSIAGCFFYTKRNVIKFVSDLWQIGDFLLVLWFPPTNNTNPHDISDIILLKVMFNTHNPTHIYLNFVVWNNGNLIWFSVRYLLDSRIILECMPCTKYYSFNYTYASTNLLQWPPLLNNNLYCMNLTFNIRSQYIS
jgi:hypothetical protein